MEAGYDYLHGRLQRRIASLTGIILLSIGLLLLISGGAYYVYSASAKSNLEDMVVVTVPREVNPINSRTASNILLFPGEAVAAESWNDLFSYEPLSLREHRLLSGFAKIDEANLHIINSLPVTRIMVPSIGIDSSVSELKIVDLGDTRHYESANNIVGHIPGADTEGTVRSSWFFGHTESPISREGSVFFNLQKIPEKLRDGDGVYIVTDNGDHQFLYRATSSQVVHQDELTLDSTLSSDIKLVSSIPRFVYDYRLVISGKLLGFK